MPRRRYAPMPSAPMAKTLVTGATGFIGSHLVRALAEPRRRAAPAGPARRPTLRRSRGRVRAGHRRHHRPPRGPARRRGRRSRLPRRRQDLAADRGPRRGLRGQRRRHPDRHRGGAARPASSGSSTPPRSRRSARRRRRHAPTRRRRSRSARSASPTSTPSTRPRSEALRVAAHGPRRRDRQPDLHARPRRPDRHVDVDAASAGSCSAGSPPTSTAASTSSTFATSPPGHLLADEKGRGGERYILGGRNFTMQRLFADLSRICGVPVPPLRLPPRLAVGGAQVSELLGLRTRARVERRAGVALVDLLAGQGEARARVLAAAARGDPRGDPRDDEGAARRPGRRRSRAGRSRARDRRPGERIAARLLPR